MLLARLASGREHESVAIDLAQRANTLDVDKTNLLALQQVARTPNGSLLWQAEKSKTDDVLFLVRCTDADGELIWAFLVDIVDKEVSTNLDAMFSIPDSTNKGEVHQQVNR